MLNTDYDRGERLRREKKYVAAKHAYLKASKDGDARAHEALGDLYAKSHDGVWLLGLLKDDAESIKANTAEALRYYQLAYQAGIANALVKLQRLLTHCSYSYVNVLGVKFHDGNKEFQQDRTLSVYCYKLALKDNPNYGWAHHNLGLCYLSGLGGLQQDRIKAAYHFYRATLSADSHESAAKKMRELLASPHVDANWLNSLGCKFHNGTGFYADHEHLENDAASKTKAQDYTQALACFHAAVAKPGSCAIALYNIGLSYLHAWGIDKDLNQAARFFYMAKQAGYQQASDKLDTLLDSDQINAAWLNKLGVKFANTDNDFPNDKAFAFSCYKRAIDRQNNGDSTGSAAYRNMGVAYRDGSGTTQNYIFAARYLQLAADRKYDIPEIQTFLAEIRSNANVAAADKLAIAKMYHYGKPSAANAEDEVKVDPHQAKLWYQAAIDQDPNLYEAHHELAYLYEIKLPHEPKHYVKAAEHYLKAGKGGFIKNMQTGNPPATWFEDLLAKDLSSETLISIGQYIRENADNLIHTGIASKQTKRYLYRTARKLFDRARDRKDCPQASHELALMFQKELIQPDADETLAALSLLYNQEGSDRYHAKTSSSLSILTAVLEDDEKKLRTIITNPKAQKDKARLVTAADNYTKQEYKEKYPRANLLWLAALHGSAAAIEVLWQFGLHNIHVRVPTVIDANGQPSETRSAIEIASEHGHIACVSSLFAKPTISDSYDLETMTRLAKARNQTNMLEYLQRVTAIKYAGSALLKLHNLIETMRGERAKSQFTTVKALVDFDISAAQANNTQGFNPEILSATQELYKALHAIYITTQHKQHRDHESAHYWEGWTEWICDWFLHASVHDAHHWIKALLVSLGMGFGATFGASFLLSMSTTVIVYRGMNWFQYGWARVKNYFYPDADNIKLYDATISNLELQIKKLAEEIYKQQEALNSQPNHSLPTDVTDMLTKDVLTEAITAAAPALAAA